MLKYSNSTGKVTLKNLGSFDIKILKKTHIVSRLANKWSMI